jgi:hypothetical protein
MIFFISWWALDGLSRGNASLEIPSIVCPCGLSKELLNIVT